MMLRSRAYRGEYLVMIERYPVSSEMITRGEVWLAEYNDSIGGFYRLDVAKADLDLMFVDDSSQGLGVGRLLFRHMLEFARLQGLNSVQIVAHPPAAWFYRKMGAVDCGIVSGKGPGLWDRPQLRIDCQ